MIELEDHDHSQCVDHVLQAADEICQKRGVRLTDQRRQVLATLAQSHVPASAYDVLDLLNKQRQADNASPLAPVSVYRALDFLQQQGLVHRIESRNAYVACLHGAEEHDEGTVFLLCDVCGNAGEFHSEVLNDLINSIASTEKFKSYAPVLEVKGVCVRCRTKE